MNSLLALSQACPINVVPDAASPYAVAIRKRNCKRMRYQDKLRTEIRNVFATDGRQLTRKQLHTTKGIVGLQVGGPRNIGQSYEVHRCRDGSKINQDEMVGVAANTARQRHRIEEEFLERASIVSCKF